MKDLEKTYTPFIRDIMREVFGHLESITPELLIAHGHLDRESQTEAQVNGFASIAMTSFCKYMKFFNEEEREKQLKLFIQAVQHHLRGE